MKKLTLISTLILAGTMNMAHAEDCAAKRAALQKEIDIAQHYNNSAKVNGLKQALAEVNTHCTHDSMLADARQDVAKLERKLEEKQADIREAEADLREAQAEGKQDKMAKYQRKIREKQADLQEIKQELAQARAEQAALQK